MSDEKLAQPYLTVRGRVAVVNVDGALAGMNWIDLGIAIDDAAKLPDAPLLLVTINSEYQELKYAAETITSLRKFPRDRMTVAHLHGRIAGLGLSLAAECRLVLAEPTASILTVEHGWTLAEQLEGRLVHYLQRDVEQTVGMLNRVVARRMRSPNPFTQPN